MKNISRNVAIWVVVVMTAIVMLTALQPGGSHKAVEKITYSEFLHDVSEHAVKTVSIRDQNISGELTDGKSFATYAPFDPSLVHRLTEAGVEVTAQPPQSDESPIMRYIGAYLPLALMLGLGFMIFRQMQNGGGAKGAMGFGKSRAKLLNEKQGRVTFADVAGIDEAKSELEEIVDFLKDPQKFTRLGGKIPKGVLLVGPPGTGKTLLARSVAGEANVPFFSISGSDFVEMFVGVGASRVRDMFEQGKKSAPCIIFIDEIDAVGRHRGVGLGGGNDEREQTLNQMLVEMDGFESNEGVILIAATNRPDVLDPALLRPGRFDRQVVVPNPDVSGREKILRVHMKKLPLSSDVDPRVIARGTPGFSGADLANLVNEAALFAAREGRNSVTMHQFEKAKDKVMMGAERRSMVMTDQEKRTTAYHEAAHAMCAYYSEGSDPIHKATIVPRGQALGMVMTLPEKDNISYSRKWCLARLVTAMGGRVGEELIFGHEEVSAGASGDIKGATDIARRMVSQWGMSDKLGMVAYDDREAISGRTAQEVDEEVRKLVDEAYAQARQLVLTHIDDLHRLAGALLEYETLTGDDVARILRGEELDRREGEVEVFSGRRGSVPPSGTLEGSAPPRPSKGNDDGFPAGTQLA
ncbi:ATP-dependent zinc metalloprotease FtsH [Oecophyllibacter saccharovorans]|uniref:ATP-dependent zinc metalloprotease FtsH n=1 Tax=Oecophyllibacter saccharovorans TaxID=2558360 RepID=A0A506UM11_9PROT|nr:ATP-dependent zinc metalloprotease FtsH [Oecophyllibacter saccharovorans]TPW34368.1 ATP-dependent metallopeptidase FtsH/Yme1/Tma family protein [Oecophyllibacter saccharovorans]